MNESCPNCSQSQSTVLHRDVPGRMLAGVCAALAQHMGWNVSLVRILFVISVAFTGGLVFWVYAAAWAMTPFGANDKSPMTRLIDTIGSLFAPPPQSTNVEKVQL